MKANGFMHSSIEALILASPEPLPARKIAQVLEDVTPSKLAKAVAELNDRYADAGMSIRIREIAGGYQHYIMPEYVGYVEELFSRQRKLRLTRAALETVAIVAYRQPVTKTEVEHIRGVASDGVIQNLMEKGMIRITGRAQRVGKPLQYGTTDEFLKFFGLSSLGDLPKMAEIEELIAAAQDRSQTELELDKAFPVGDFAEKLNIADGTFDPQAREALDQAVEDGEMTVVTAEDEQHQEASSLVLKRSSEGDEPDTVDETSEQETAEAETSEDKTDETTVPQAERTT